MRVVFLTLGNENVASSRVRVFQYIPYLKNENIKTRVFVRNPYFLGRSKNPFLRLIQGLHIRINIFTFLIFSIFYQNIFVQKTFLPKWIIVLFVLLQKNFIYEFDDAIYSTEKNKRIQGKRIKRLEFMLRNAKCVITTTEQNRQFAIQCGNLNTIIISGPIDCNRYFPAINKENSDIVIGWIGSSGTSNYLNIVKEPLEFLCNKYPNLKIILIGAKDFDIQIPAIEQYTWELKTEVELIQRFDIGIMPLYNDIWCMGKGGYKFLQYMAVGIPSVVSPVGVNVNFANMEDCSFMASNDSEWIECLEKLIVDKELRIRMGENARRIALNNYSYEINSKTIIGTFIK